MKYLLALGLALSFITRVIIPFKSVFTQQGIILNTPDAYIILRYAEIWPNFPAWDWFSNYPVGIPGFYYTAYSALLGMIARVLNISVWAVGAWMPVLLFYLSLVPVYIIAKSLFNREVAFGSVFIYCLLPGDLLERTMLGAADYHAWEILLFLTAMMFFILALRNWEFALPFVCFTGLYFVSWGGASLLLAVILAGAWLFAFLRGKAWPLRTGLLVLPIMGGLGLFLGFPKLFYRLIGYLQIRLDTFNPEEMSLLFNAGQLDISTIWNYYGFVFFLMLIALGWFGYRTWKSMRLIDCVFLCWTLVALWLTICLRRFSYYLVLNTAILTAALAFSVGKVSLGYIIVWGSKIASKERIVKYYVLLGIAVFLPLCFNSIRLVQSNPYNMSEGWQHVCQWFAGRPGSGFYYYSAQKPPSGVLAEWQHGYDLITLGHQAVMQTPANGAYSKEFAQLMMAEDYQGVLKMLQAKRIRYIVLDKEVVEDHQQMLQAVAGTPATNSFMSILYYQDIQGVELAYQYEDIKVYEIVK